MIHIDNSEAEIFYVVIICLEQKYLPTSLRTFKHNFNFVIESPWHQKQDNNR